MQATLMNNFAGFGATGSWLWLWLRQAKQNDRQQGSEFWGVILELRQHETLKPIDRWMDRFYGSILGLDLIAA